MQNNTRVGFIGLGIMGSSTAGHTLAAGHPLNVYNHSREKADALVAAGARWHATPGEVVAASDVVITMLGYPHDVEQVYLGEDGLVARAVPGAILIDMMTSSPALVQRIAEQAAGRGVQAIERRFPAGRYLTLPLS